jgi:hypothetical protein
MRNKAAILATNADLCVQLFTAVGMGMRAFRERHTELYNDGENIFEKIRLDVYLKSPNYNEKLEFQC